MKKLLLFLMVGIMIVSSMTLFNVSATVENANASAPETFGITEPAKVETTEPNVDGFVYKITGKTVKITGYIGNKKSVTIPNTIKGKPVTIIGKECFMHNSIVEKVAIGKNVEIIEKRAFSYCKNLSKVTFGKKVYEIGTSTFAFCEKLKKITLPVNLYEIKSCVFIASGLKSINITKNVQSIKIDALDIKTLKKITVSKQNKYFSSKDGVLYNKKQTKLIICPQSIAKTNLALPKTVKTIGFQAFQWNKTLKKIVLPKKLKKIGMVAFANCKKLKTITIPKSVTEIEEEAFVAPFTIKGYKNSYAQKWSKEYKGIKFVIIK